jgi:MoaA/NifB/PqqE/SkfB family radical SAM enzyme
VSRALTYTFRTTHELDGLRAVVVARDGKLRVRTAPGAPLQQRFLVRMFFEFLGGIPPLAEIDGALQHSLYVPPAPSPANERLVEAFLRRTVLDRPTPMAVTIAVTDGCQMHCGHCSAAMGERGAGPAAGDRRPLALHELRRVVDESLGLGVGNMTFTGGEPLLRRDLEELVAAVDPRLAISQVFTNGLLLDEARARDLKCAGLHAVQISLDAADPAEHDRLRGVPGAFAGVRDAVRAARQAGLLVGLSTYATNESVEAETLPRLLRLAEEWGVQEVSVFDVIPTGRLHGRPDALLRPDARRALLRQAARHNRARDRRRPHVTTQSWTNSGRGFAWFIGCLAWNWQFHVNAYGDATPCDFTPLSFGNVRDWPLAEIWAAATDHPEWRRRSRRCRMQSADFRSRYVDRIPAGATLPYPIAALDL